MKEGLTPEEVNVHTIDFVGAGVDTVRYLSYNTSLLKKMSELKQKDNLGY